MIKAKKALLETIPHRNSITGPKCFQNKRPTERPGKKSVSSVEKMESGEVVGVHLFCLFYVYI